MARLLFILLTITLIGIILCPDASFGLGINCRGSSSCSSIYNLNKLTATVCSLPQGNQYGPNVRLATNCVAASGIAAFTQSTDRSITASQACNLLRRLQDHGCKVCGSIPLDFPGDNDVKHGQLTVNYVGSCA